MNRRESIFAMFLGVCGLRTKLPEKKIKSFKQTWTVVSGTRDPAEMFYRGEIPEIGMTFDEAMPADIKEFNEYLKGLKRYLVLSGECAVSFE